MTIVTNLTKVEEYLSKIVGTPYVWWMGATILGKDTGPFYAVNGPAPDPEVVKNMGVCCTGVVNLARRKLGLSVPGVEEQDPFAGGTGAWYKFLKPHLQPFDPTKTYEPGTLFFRPYMTFEDQGHIGIKLEGDTFLHSYVEVPVPREGLCEPGCSRNETWATSHNWHPEGYYLYTAPPSAWLI